MKLEDRVMLSRTNEKERNALIKEYSGFVKSSASRATRRFITENDDEFSVALIAFNEAIDRYEKDKGSFTSYASLVIKSRVTDNLRKKGVENIPFSSLTEDEEEIDVVGLADVVSDAALEIKELSDELERYGITFLTLSEHVPVSRKTKAAVGSIIKYILEDELRVKRVLDSGRLPSAEIVSEVSVHKKISERHRKYIIAAIIILTGDYYHVRPYIMGIFDAGRC